MSRALAAVFLILVLGALGWAILYGDVLPHSAAQNRPSTDRLLLVPGESAGQITIGMGRADCERILGQASVAENLDDGQVVTWNALGISVQMAKGSHPMQSNTEEVGTVVANILVSSPRYETEAGLHAGMSAADVERLMGPAEHHNDMLAYPQAGINFILDSDKVTEIIIFAKP